MSEKRRIIYIEQADPQTAERIGMVRKLHESVGKIAGGAGGAGAFGMATLFVMDTVPSKIVAGVLACVSLGVMVAGLSKHNAIAQQLSETESKEGVQR